MKNLLMIFSSVFSLLFVSAVSAQQPSGYFPANPACVGRCDSHCVPVVPVVPEYHNGHFYVGGFGGANWLKYDRTHHVHPKMKEGYVGALSIGHKFHNGFRLEAEVAYRNNSIHSKDTLKSEYCENVKLRGKTFSWSYMANALIDFDSMPCYVPNLVPYVGLGVGYTTIEARVKAHNEIASATTMKSKKDGLAGQAIAGISYRLASGTSVGVEYRYFMAKEHVRDHSVGLSLRQAF